MMARELLADDMTEVADILVVNRNTYPWIRIQAQQIDRLRPRTPIRYQIWDNDSTDGSREWLASNGIDHQPSKKHICHSKALEEMVKLSSNPIIVFMDSDAFPIKSGWLDDVVRILKDPKVGAAGFQFGVTPNKVKEPAVLHPSFLVIRREVYCKVGLSICEERKNGVFLDVAIPMGRRLLAAGLRLVFVGHPNLHLMTPGQKVMHVYGASGILNRTYPDENSVRQHARKHLKALGGVGLLDPFLQYVRESFPRNPLCRRYLDWEVKHGKKANNPGAAQARR